MEDIVAAETWLDGQPSDFFLRGLRKLEQRAKKCIELHVEYVELMPSLVAVACFLPGRAKDLPAPLVQRAVGHLHKHFSHIRAHAGEINEHTTFLAPQFTKLIKPVTYRMHLLHFTVRKP